MTTRPARAATMALGLLAWTACIASRPRDRGVDDSLRFDSWPDADVAPFAAHVLDARTVILGNRAAYQFMWRVGARSVWLPAPEDVRRAEVALEAHLRERADEPWPALDGLGRQWAGVLHDDGRRVLYGSFFPFDGDMSTAPWRDHPVHAGRAFVVFYEVADDALTEVRRVDDLADGE